MDDVPHDGLGPLHAGRHGHVLHLRLPRPQRRQPRLRHHLDPGQLRGASHRHRLLIRPDLPLRVRGPPWADGQLARVQPSKPATGPQAAHGAQDGRHDPRHRWGLLRVLDALRHRRHDRAVWRCALSDPDDLRCSMFAGQGGHRVQPAVVFARTSKISKKNSPPRHVRHEQEPQRVDEQLHGVHGPPTHHPVDVM